MNFGNPTGPLAFNLAHSFTRTVRRFDYVSISFQFALISLSLRTNRKKKKKNEKRVTRALAQIFLLHLRRKGKFPWWSFPYIIIN